MMEKNSSSKEYNIRIVDRVGGGDSFASGIIHGLLTTMILKGFRFAVAVSFKHTIHGDFNMVLLMR